MDDKNKTDAEGYNEIQQAFREQHERMRKFVEKDPKSELSVIIVSESEKPEDELIENRQGVMVKVLERGRNAAGSMVVKTESGTAIFPTKKSIRNAGRRGAPVEE